MRGRSRPTRGLAPLCLAELVLIAALAASAATTAQAAPVDARSSAAAEALYQEGKQLLIDGRAELARQKLETSQALESAVGTLLLLGHCYEQLGKTASAWATFRSAESLATAAEQDARAEIARVRAEALESRLARLTLSVPDGVDTRNWSLREDERELSTALLGAPIPVDPGSRRITVSAPGYETWSTGIDVPSAPGVTLVRIPSLLPERALERPLSTLARAGVEPSRSRVQPPAGDGDTPQSARTLRTWSYVGLGLGAVALGVGGGYAMIAKNRYGDSLEVCRTETLCGARGLALRESAESHARVATVASLSGVLLATAGLVGWLLAPDSEPRTESEESGAKLELTTLGSELSLGIGARGTF